MPIELIPLMLAVIALRSSCIFGLLTFCPLALVCPAMTLIGLQVPLRHVSPKSFMHGFVLLHLLHTCESPRLLVTIWCWLAVPRIFCFSLVQRILNSSLWRTCDALILFAKLLFAKSLALVLSLCPCSNPLPSFLLSSETDCRMYLLYSLRCQALLALSFSLLLGI